MILHFQLSICRQTHTLGEVSRHILNYLNDHEAEQLYYALHVQKEFSNMLIKGYSLSALLEQLGHLLARPALLLNHRGEKIAQSHDFLKESMKEIKQEILQKVKEDLAYCSRRDNIFNPFKRTSKCFDFSGSNEASISKHARHFRFTHFALSFFTNGN